MVTCSRILISKFQFQNFGSLMHMGLVLSSVQNFKLIWLWTIFVTNCFKFLVVLVIWMMACYFPFWCLRLIVMFAFWQKKIYKKNVFLCVAYVQYPNMFWMFFYIQKILEVLKNVFSHGFLKHNKKLFSCILGFYNMFVKL